MISTGGRYTVRDFDGEATLMRANGWYLRNEFATKFPKQQAELYLGLDVGAVYGYGADLYNGHVLAGARRSRNGQRYFLRYFRCRAHRKTRRIPHAGCDLRFLPRVEVLMAILQKVANQSTDVV